jgi:hypothetical protein
VTEQGELCTAVSCPNFEFCRDVVDLSQVCIGTACAERDTVRYVLNSAFLVVALGCFFDFLDAYLMFRQESNPRTKFLLNFAACGGKLLAYCALRVGRSQQFIERLVSNACFNDVGMQTIRMMANLITVTNSALFVTGICSLTLAPINVYWAGRLDGVPNFTPSNKRYGKSHERGENGDSEGSSFNEDDGDDGDEGRQTPTKHRPRGYTLSRWL